jgi:ParB/RepB/Spo0J family partition protein
MKTTAPATTTEKPNLQLMLDPRELLESENPRKKKPSDSYLQEMADSMSKFGVLQNLVVRPAAGKTDVFQVVAGDTRRQAAIKAGLIFVPCTVRELDDTAMLELQLIENVQRNDMHPLDEGEAFQRLIDSGRHTVDSLASTVGKSTRWIYQRIEFVRLTPAAKKLFAADTITASHAERLVRLTEAQQKQVIEHGLFTRDLHGNERPVSTAELDNYIAYNIRLPIERATEHPQALPEIAAAAAEVEAAGEKLLQVSSLYGGNSTSKGVIGMGGWKEIKGKRDSCAHSERAVIVMGSRQGERVTVCRDQKGCAKHWPELTPAAERKETPKARAARERAEKLHRRYLAKQEAERKAAAEWSETWKNAEEHILDAIADAKTLKPELVRIAALGVVGNQPAIHKRIGTKLETELARVIVMAYAINRGKWNPSDCKRVTSALGFDLRPFAPGYVAPETKAPAPKAKKAPKRKAGAKK